MQPSNRSLLALYSSYLAPSLLGWPLVALYCVTVLQFSIAEFLGSYAIAYATTILLALSGKTASSRKMFIAAGVACMLEFAVFAFAKNFTETTAAFIGLGIVQYCFWTVYNALFFNQQAHQHNAKRGASYYLAFNAFAIIMPFAGGIIANAYGFTTVFLFAAASFLPFLFLAFSTEDMKIEFNFNTAWNEAKGYKTLALLEGAINVAPIAFISTAFYPNPKDFGSFTAFLAVAALAAMLLVAKASDSRQTRKSFLNPLMAALGILVILASGAKNAAEWTLAVAAFTFTSTITNPLLVAVILDKKNPTRHSMVVREAMLNTGRITGIGLTIAAAWAGLKGPQLVLPTALACFAYVAAMHAKKTA